MIYFDNSATTYPKPPEVVCAAAAGITRYGGNPGRGGHEFSARISQKVFETRNLLSELFGAQPERVIFTENCTMSLNMAIRAIPNGADVLTSDLEHNAVIRPLEQARKNGRLRYRIFSTGGSQTELMQNLSRMVRPDTKAIVMTAASNVTGRILPVREVGAFCRRRKILFIVDAAQAAGVIPLHLEEDQIDILCMSGHKGLYGITGTGVLIFSERVRIPPFLYGGTGTESLSPDQPDSPPESLEAGTLPTVGICALHAGVTYLLNHGIQKQTEKNLCLCKKLTDSLLTMPQAKIYSAPPEWGVSVPIVSFTFCGEPSEVTAQKLNRAGFAVRGGYHCAGVTHRKLHTMQTGLVRFSPGSFNTEGEVMKFICALKRIARVAEP